jgi:hypothetical protein
MSDIIIPVQSFFDYIYCSIGKRCTSYINIRLLSVLPERLDRLAADQTVSLVIQMPMEMVQGQLMMERKNGLAGCASDL